MTKRITERELIANIQQQIAAAEHPAQILKGLYTLYSQFSTATTPKGKQADEKYGTLKLNCTQARAIPTKDGIATISLRKAFDHQMQALFGLDRPSQLLAAFEDALTELNAEGYRMEYPKLKAGGVMELLAGPDVPQFEPTVRTKGSLF
jgi:hypothetical protein